jgi:adenylylsulfate kinase-like enzyme
MEQSSNREPGIPASTERDGNMDEAMSTICCWLTGPSGAGKTTIAVAVVEELVRRGRPAVAIDDADVDRYLDAGDRLGAVLWLADLLVGCDTVPVVAISAPTREVRDRARRQLTAFAEIFVDPGTLPAEYEEPYGPELRVPTHDRDDSASTAQVVSWLESRGVVSPAPRR